MVINNLEYWKKKGRKPDEALIAWLSLQAQHPDLVGMVCLDSYRRSALLPSVKKYTKAPLNYLVPYFESEHIYFLEEGLVKVYLEERNKNLILTLFTREPIHVEKFMLATLLPDGVPLASMKRNCFALSLHIITSTPA